jgi:GT2 family glycosyltransferase
VSPERLSVSVVMATRDRAPHVADCVASIVAAAQAEPTVDVEILVVDNGSRDATPEALRTLTETCPIPFTGLTEPIAGVSRARNRGLDAANGDVIVLTDDDCRLAIDYFTALAGHFRGRADPVMIGGRVELGDPRDLPFTIKIDDAPSRLDLDAHPGGFILGANMAMTRAVLRVVGGFDIQFGAGSSVISAEDTELYLRARTAGVPVEYVPDMTVFHFHGRRTYEEVAELSRRYQIGNGAMLAKHWRTSPGLLRHFWWNLRNAVREKFGGPLFDPEMKLSHADIVAANIKGFALYLKRPRVSA